MLFGDRKLTIMHDEPQVSRCLIQHVVGVLHKAFIVSPFDAANQRMTITLQKKPEDAAHNNPSRVKNNSNNYSRPASLLVFFSQEMLGDLVTRTWP